MIHSNPTFKPEVNDLKKQPQQRRRWWRWAVFLALSIVATVWWNWPRGDLRFVGTWGLYRPNRTQPSFIMRLSSNGGGWSTHLSNGKVTRLKWSVDGDVLNIGYGTPGAPPALLLQLQRWMREHFGWSPWIIWGEEWRILHVKPTEIRLDPGGPEVLTLRRVEE